VGGDIHLGTHVLRVAVEASIGKRLHAGGCHQQRHCHGDADVRPDGQDQEGQSRACGGEMWIT